MKMIGLLGGMSWESSLEYYRVMNETVRDRLGGLHSARCMLYSVEFGEVAPLLDEGRHDELTAALCTGAAALGRAGADLVLIATNTMHLYAGAVEAAAGVPLLHIADATGEAIGRAGLKTVALLGTTVTMEEDFYRTRLEERFGIRTIVPQEREEFDRIIFDELCRGVVRDSSREWVTAAIDDCISRGAEGVILGCTELPMLVSRAPVPLFNTTRIHAEAAVDHALEDDRPG